MPLNSVCGAVTGSISGSKSGRAAVAMATKPAAAKPTALLAGVSAALTVRLAKLVTALRHRRELEQLAAYSDRELRDLAVTRNDIAFALAEPFWRDPAVALRQARRPLFETEGSSGCSKQGGLSRAAGRLDARMRRNRDFALRRREVKLAGEARPPGWRFAQSNTI